MLKKRSKAISMLVCMAFLFTMIMPGLAFASSAVDFSYSTATVADNEDPQNLGFVKIDDIDEVEAVYVELALPADVDWETPIADGTIDTYITTNDAAVTATADLITGDGDEYVVCFDTSAATFSTLYIKLKFSDIVIDDDAADDIYASVTVRGVDEDGNQAWKTSEDCLIGQKGESEITVSAKSAKTIAVGAGQEMAKVTFTENVEGAFAVGDEIVMTLPSDIKWDTNVLTVGDTFSGNYGLEATVTVIDGDELTLEITDASDTFEDKFSITGTVKVYPGADDGDVEVSIEGNVDADFDDTSLVLAVIGENDVTIDVDDDSDDVILPASYDKALDSFTIEGSADFAIGDTITLSLPDGVKWYYDDEADFDADADGVTCLGFYSDNESVWLEVDAATDTLEFDNLLIATTNAVEIGDITMDIGEDYNGSFVIGTIVDSAEVSADAPVITTGEVTADAGDITIVETSKKRFNGATTIVLSAPNGVDFAENPTVSINGDEVDADFDIDDEEITITVDADEFASSKVDTVVISDITYDLDSRLNKSEITVKIGGNLVNYLTDADAGSADIGIEDDYAAKSVYSVVNATTQVAGNADSLFTIGSTTYTINGVEYTMDVAPYISGDRTFMPIRYVAYALGINDANILWDGANQTVTLMKGDKVVQLKVGSTTLLINGAAVTMDVAPVNVNGRVCLPIRFVAQAFGAEVGWDGATQQVTIEM